MDPPDVSAIDSASRDLYDIGALADDDDMAPVTKLGRLMVHLPADPVNSVMLVLGLAFGCLEEAIVMVAYSAGETFPHRSTS